MRRPGSYVVAIHTHASLDRDAGTKAAAKGSDRERGQSFDGGGPIRQCAESRLRGNLTPKSPTMNDGALRLEHDCRKRMPKVLLHRARACGVHERVRPPSDNGARGATRTRSAPSRALRPHSGDEPQCGALMTRTAGDCCGFATYRRARAYSGRRREQQDYELRTGPPRRGNAETPAGSR